jgi:hypothetical protein
LKPKAIAERSFKTMKRSLRQTREWSFQDRWIVTVWKYREVNPSQAWGILYY